MVNHLSIHILFCFTWFFFFFFQKRICCIWISISSNEFRRAQTMQSSMGGQSSFKFVKYWNSTFLLPLIFPSQIHMIEAFTRLSAKKLRIFILIQLPTKLANWGKFHPCKVLGFSGNSECSPQLTKKGTCPPSKQCVGTGWRLGPYPVTRHQSSSCSSDFIFRKSVLLTWEHAIT